MATYTLQGSYPTVQVLSPSLVQDVQYCTIQTQESGVIASYPVRKTDFDGGYASQILDDFVAGIEYVMALPHVIAGIGAQTIDDNGLLTDSVVFTVEYTAPVAAPNGVTNSATIPAAELYAVPQELERGSAVTVVDYVTEAYDALKAAAGG